MCLLPEYADNLVLLDTGQVKLMTPYFPSTNCAACQAWKG